MSTEETVRDEAKKIADDIAAKEALLKKASSQIHGAILDLVTSKRGNFQRGIMRLGDLKVAIDEHIKPGTWIYDEPGRSGDSTEGEST